MKVKLFKQKKFYVYHKILGLYRADGGSFVSDVKDAEKYSKREADNILKGFECVLSKVNCRVFDKNLSEKKCTTCRFNNGKYDNCTAGSYYAEKGLNRICYEGELWEQG